MSSSNWELLCSFVLFGVKAAIMGLVSEYDGNLFKLLYNCGKCSAEEREYGHEIEC